MTTETTSQVTQPAPAPTQAPAVDDSATVPKSRFEVVERNAGEWKAKAEEAAAKLASYQEAERKAVEEVAKKAGEWEKLVADRDNKIADLESATKAAELRARRESARALLSARGMVDPLAQDGALSRVAGEGDFDASAWVEKLAQEHPASFQAHKHAPKPGVAGTVANNAPETLVERLASSDHAVRIQAREVWAKENGLT